MMRKWAVDRRRSSRRRSPAIPDRTRAARLPDRRDRDWRERLEGAEKAPGLVHHVPDGLGVGPGALPQAGEGDLGGCLRRLLRDGGEGRDGGLSRGVHGDGAAVLVGHHPVPDPLKDLRVKGLEGELGVELAGFHDRLPPDGMWILHILCASGGRGTGVAGGAVL